ncbi:MAG: hypothetical protein LIO95_07245 [Clostridiales bacterium]|nr:hypothetical protein [Clostridiales bacterium]
MSTSSDNVGSVALALTLDTSAFSTKLNSVAKKAASTLAAALSVKAITSFTKQCIELGSDLQEVQNVVDVTFSTMSDKVDEFAQSAAASFGLSETMAKQYTGMFGSMAEAFGFTEKEAYEMSTTLTGLAGDVASFYNITQDEAYTKLKSVFSGETETLKDLGIVMTQDALDAYALANGFGKTTSAMTEAEKVSLRYAFIQDQLSNATGDFARTQDSWANQSRLLALQVQSAMAAVGQGLINLLTPALKAINTMMASIVKLANAFNSLIEALFGSASGGTSAVSSDLTSAASSASSLADSLTDGTSAISGLGDSTGSAAKSLGKASKTAAALKRSLEGFDQITRVSDDSSSDSSGSGSGSGDTGSGTGSAGTSGVDTSALDSVTDAAEEAETSVSKLSKKMSALLAPAVAAWNNLKNSFSAFAAVVQSAGTWILNNALAPLGAWTISAAVPAVLNLLAAAFDVLTAVLEALAPTAQWIWEQWLQPLASWTGGVIIAALEGLTSILDGLADIISKNQAVFTGLFNVLAAVGIVVTISTAIQKLVGVVSGLATAFSMASSVWALLQAAFIANPIGVVVTAITAIIAVGVLLYKNWDTLTAAAQKLWSGITSAFEGIKTTISSAMNAVKTTISKAWTKIKTTFNNALKSISTKVSNGFNSVKTTITTIFTSVKTKLSSIWTGIKTVFTNAVTSIKTKVTTVFNAVKTAITNPLTTAKNTVSNILTAIKNKFTSIMSSVKTTVSNAINAVKEKFNFSWSLPKLKLPHVSITGSFSLSPPSVPKFSVSWYKKAMDNPMLLNGATIFGAAGGNLLGGGEAGQEVVSGASTLMNMIQEAVQSGLSSCVTDLSGLAARNTPRLAAVTSDSQAKEQQLQANSLAQSAQDLEAVETLLKEILAFLQSADLVRLDPESLRKYFIKKTNNNTRANGGKCELVT